MNIGFYSYKGGVGRTIVMANLGAYLAMKGRRVGMLDFVFWFMSFSCV